MEQLLKIKKRSQSVKTLAPFKIKGWLNEAFLKIIEILQFFLSNQ